jgi:hypothetical protein
MLSNKRLSFGETIYWFADRDRQSAERKRVQADAAKIQSNYRDKQGKRDGGERDNGNPKIEQEQKQNDTHERRADEQRVADIADCFVDETGRPKQVRVEFDLL